MKRGDYVLCGFLVHVFWSKYTQERLFDDTEPITFYIMRCGEETPRKPQDVYIPGGNPHPHPSMCGRCYHLWTNKSDFEKVVKLAENLDES